MSDNAHYVARLIVDGKIMELIHTWTCNFGIWIDLICAVWWLTIILFVNGFQLKIEKEELLILIGFLVGAGFLTFSRTLGIKIGSMNFENMVFLIGIHTTIGMLRVSITLD
jgi:hypothetical protein